MSRAATNLQIDSARLWGAIHETAQFGGTAKGGVRRLTLSSEDKQVRDWFRKACEDAGLEVHTDALGSQFGLRKGRDMSKLPVGIGSHLDTQPTGGKYDGILGTLGALEVIRTLNDAGIETEAPICVVNWTNEEGSRFAPAMMASAAYVGDFTTDDILSRKDIDGTTVSQALEHMRTYKPVVYMPAHHDAPFTGRAGLWRSTEPLFQAMKDENPALITVSKQYREPVCFNTEVNIQRSR